MTNTVKIIAKNKRAFYEYAIGERLEAGLVLLGAEVKSVKTGHINLAGSFVTVRDGEAYLLNAHIPPYPFAQIKSYDPTRTRKLLLSKRELMRLTQEKGKGIAIVPMAVYLKRGKVKLEIAVGTGKKAYDKRQTIKERETKREIDSRVKLKNR